ncbi:MAG: oligoendopeptidase F [Deinococcota bacterium]|jgi:oligoendopeptidase F|nr:oligoendopeptidase F [Deinococcota bacterium]
MNKERVPHRSEVDPRYTWNLESVFDNPQEWEGELERLKAAIPELNSYKGRLDESASTLHTFLEKLWELQVRLNKLASYAYLGTAVDEGNQEARALQGRAEGLQAEWETAIAFVDPELLTLGQEKVGQFLQEEPKLQTYARMLEKLERLRPHTRSEEVETVLGQASHPFAGVWSSYSSLAMADLKFKLVEKNGEAKEVTHGTIGALLKDSDREVRKQAFESYADGHLAFKNSLADLLLTKVKQDVFHAQVRNYPSSREAAIYPSELPVEVHEAVITAFKENLPIWHRYWQLRRKALGVEKLEPWDVFASMGQEAIEVPYEEACRWISEGMAPLGEDYVTAMQRGLEEEGWVDVYPNQGKRAGAFSGGTYGTYPFILMSYNDDLASMSILAHELGHSMHGYLSDKKQAPVNAQYTLFAAEVASNLNQALVRRYLLEKNPDPTFQLGMLEEAFVNFHRYYFIMPTLARFEMTVHAAVERGEGLNADKLTRLMMDLLKEGYGDSIEVDERSGILWAQFLHLYMNFYVFTYTTGIAGAAALAEGVLENRPGAKENYLAFLSAGGSKPPIEALQDAGVDMTAPDAVGRGFVLLKNMVDRLEVLI